MTKLEAPLKSHVVRSPISIMQGMREQTPEHTRMQ